MESTEFDFRKLKTIAVVGGGVMGSGIATALALKGFVVQVQDIHSATLQKARSYLESFTMKSVEKQKMTEENRKEILQNVTFSENLADLKADFIIEAIPEVLQLKWDVFRFLESTHTPETIFATNTSSLSVTEIAAGLQYPERCIGMHFFNPAPIMKLVEIIAGAQTMNAVITATIQLTQAINKTPAQVADTPGFIVNRVARHFYLESLKICEEHIADFETIDVLMEATGFRMGPFKLMDLIGIDTNHEVTKSIYHGFFHEPRFRPSRIQQKKVEAGHFGKKSGKGFYQYP